MNSADTSKFLCFTSSLTQHHSFFRNPFYLRIPVCKQLHWKIHFTHTRSIFSPELFCSLDLWPTTPPLFIEHVTLLFVGDVAFSGPVKYYVEHGYHTYNDSFNDVASYIREADISVANLESPFVSKEVYRYKYKGRKSVILDASPNAAPALR